MNLSHSRIGLLIPNTTPIWTGTANGAQSATFVLAVTTITGTLTTGIIGMAMVRAGVDIVRIKGVSGSNISLAENPITFAASDPVVIYALRLPFPRYQRLVSTTVYKDYDVAFPATWQHINPPTAVVTPECAWLKTGVVQRFDASGSRAMASGATGDMTATWDATGWGTTSPSGYYNGVTNCYCDLTPTSTGFHYLKLTITDNFSGATTHYIPIWVDTTPTSLLSMEMDWSLDNGWRGRCSIDSTIAWSIYLPVAVVDLDTREILLFGFWRPDRIGYEFGVTTSELEIASPLAAADWLHGYPFTVTDIADPGTDPPADWSEVGQLTVARAAWHLLVWHSMLPQLVNIDLGDGGARRIAGQSFSAGSLSNLLGQVISAAFYGLRTARTGGVTMAVVPLYSDSGTWAALPTITLTAAQRNVDYTIQPANPRYADVRLSGVYMAVGGEYAPAIARCPTNPAPWGNGTGEVTNLAPWDSTELLSWAGRHFAVENQSVTLDFEPLTDINPATYARITSDISAASTVSIDSIRMAYSEFVWKMTVSGRTYDAGPGSVAVPVPPVIVTPAPTPPPVTPPVDPLPPAPEPCEWPLRVYVATRSRGVYYTDDFSGPDGSQPTWTRLTDSDTWPIIQADISLATETVFAICDTGSYNDLYRWTSGGGWECVLTRAEAVSIMGLVGGNIKWVKVASNGNIYLLCSGTLPSTAGVMHLLVSTLDGARSGGAPSFADVGQIAGWMYQAGNLMECSTYWAAAMNKTGGGGSGRVYTGPISGGDWNISASLGISNWMPSCYYDQNNDAIYAGTSDGILSRLLYDFVTWIQPTGVAGLAGILPRLDISFPCFYAWDTNLHVTIGAGTYAKSIQWSSDLWETFNTSGDIGRKVDMLVGIATHPQNLILGRYAVSGETGEYHVSYVNDDLGDTQPVERAGVDPNNTGTTVSIPSNCGGIARNGILLPPDYCEV